MNPKGSTQIPCCLKCSSFKLKFKLMFKYTNKHRVLDFHKKHEGVVPFQKRI